MTSVFMRAAKFALRVRGKRHMLSEAAFRNRFGNRKYPSPAPIPRALKIACQIEKRELNNCSVFTLTPRAGAVSAHMIYTHGGAYVKAITYHHWNIIRQIIDRTGAAVTVPLYGLAPENTFKAAYDLLEQVFLDVAATVPAHRIVFCGDSAGGGLALGQASYFRKKGLPLPGRVVLFAPWLDITLSNPGLCGIEKKDVLLALPGLIQAGRWWADGADARSPLLSPLFGDLSGLPPIDVFQGTHDLFAADARKLDTAVTAAGGTINLHEYPGAFHVFVAATFTPEARDVFEKVSRVVPLQ